MWVTEDLVQWLTQLQILSHYEITQTGDDRYEFQKQTQLNFENGLVFAKIAKQLSYHIAKSQKRPETPLPQLDGLKELNSPSAKIYNWNILVQIFKKFNVTVDPDVKSLIVAGDHQMMQELLKELQAVYFTWNPPVQKTGNIYNLQQGQGQQQQNKNYKEQIDLTKLDITKDVSRSSSCLEFFIIILSKHLELDPKQTASLFTHGNKYLAHVLAKGVKGLFDPIVGFYTEVYSNVNTLLRLFNEDPTHKSMHFSLNALKPGLVSKSFDVADWAARLISKLAFEFGDNILLMHAWEWFVGLDGQGLNMVLLGLKRHPDLKKLIVSTLLQFARFNFVELFTTHLQKSQPEQRDLFNTYTQLLAPLMESKLSREEIISSGILDDWIDGTFEALAEDYKNPDLKGAALTFLVEVWLIYPGKIEDQEMKANNLTNHLAKSIRDNSQPLQYTSLVLQFKLLLHFGLEKNPYAPIVYKTLALSLIENNMNSQMREFILNNFITIYETLDNIPLHILVEPLIRQIQVTDQNQFSYNVFDFNFFTYISRHERLQIKNAIQLLDLLAKIFLNNIVYSQLAMVPILTIVQKNVQNETMQEFVIKFIKIALAMYYASEKKKRPKEKILPLYNNKAALQQSSISPQELDNEIINAQKRSLIVQIIKNIAQIQNPDLNEKIVPLVAHTNIQIKNFRKENNKGMMSILDCFGNGEQVLQRYEEEFKEHQKLLKQEERDMMDKEQELLAQSIEKYNFGEETKDETLLLIEQNLSKYGIGHKHAKLSKDEITRLALLRNPKASKKTMQTLQEIKENFQTKQEMKNKIDIKNQSIVDIRKKTNRTTLAKRALEQGVANYNQIDQDTIMLYEFGKREQSLNREGKMGIRQIVYINLHTEETRDYEMVTLIMKKYHKVLRYIYLKYANTGFNIKEKHQIKKTFDEIKETSKQISIPECWKMVTDYGLNKQKGQERVFIKQDQYYKDLTINKERIISSKLDKEKGIFNVLIERDFDLVTQLENQQIVQVTNQYVNTQQTAKKGGVDQKSVSKHGLQYVSQGEDSKHYTTDKKGNKRDVNKSYQNLDKTENQNLDYDGFYLYFIQLSLHLNKKYPSDLKHLPMSACVQQVLDRIKESWEKQKLNVALFENPEGAHFGEDQVIQKFNEELEKDPKYLLPEGYVKKKDKIITFNYDTSILPISDNFKMCYEIVQEIFQDMKIPLVEPRSTTKEVIRAHPLFNDGMKGKSQFYDLHMKPQLPWNHKKEPGPLYSETPDMSKILKKGDGTYVKHMKNRATMSAENLFKILPGSTFGGYVNKYGKKKNLPIENHHKLSLSMKLSISQFDYKNRWTAEQCAYVLDDMIKVLETHNREFVPEGLFHPSNPVKELKQQQKQDKLDKREEDYKNFQIKKDKLKEEKLYKTKIDPKGRQIIGEDKKKEYEELQKKKEEEEQKKKEDEEKRKQEEEKRMDDKKKFREKWIQKQKEKSQKAQEERQQKQDEMKKEQQEQEKEKKQKKKEEFKKFNDDKIGQYQKGFNKIEQERKKQQDEKKEQIKQQKPKREKLYKKIIQSDAKRNEFEKETENQIKDLSKQEDVQEVFSKHKFKLEYLFTLLRKFTFLKIGEPAYVEEINLKTFNWFCFHFSLYPEVMHYVDSILIYRSTTQVQIKNQKVENVRQIGMNYEKFLEALVRIACKGKKVFNTFQENIDKQGGQLNESQVQDQRQQDADNNDNNNNDPNQSVNQSVQGENNNPDNKELDNNGAQEKYVKLVDDYGNITECTAKTIECLVFYLALPDDKQGLDERFRQILEEGYKPDLKQKKELLSKLQKNPKNLAKNNQSMYQQIDEDEEENANNNVLDGEDQQQNNNDGDNNDNDQQDDNQQSA